MPGSDANPVNLVAFTFLEGRKPAPLHMGCARVFYGVGAFAAVDAAPKPGDAFVYDPRGNVTRIR